MDTAEEYHAILAADFPINKTIIHRNRKVDVMPIFQRS